MQTDEASPGYIRGGGGVVDPRRLFRVVVGLAIGLVAVLVVVLAIQAVHKNARIDGLQRRGVPVDVTVTDCLGILSGTGVTVAYFQCSGSFELGGHSYHAVIDGSHINHQAGDVVQAVADPKHPTSISLASSLVSAHSSWRAFIGAGVLFVLLLLMIAGVWWWSRRNSAQRPPDGDALG